MYVHARIFRLPSLRDSRKKIFFAKQVIVDQVKEDKLPAAGDTDEKRTRSRAAIERVSEWVNEWAEQSKQNKELKSKTRLAFFFRFGDDGCSLELTLSFFLSFGGGGFANSTSSFKLSENIIIKQTLFSFPFASLPLTSFSCPAHSLTKIKIYAQRFGWLVYYGAWWPSPELNIDCH